MTTRGPRCKMKKVLRKRVYEGEKLDPDRRNGGSKSRGLQRSRNLS